MIQDSGAAEDDIEGLASIPRAIEGVLIGVTIREKTDGGFKNFHCVPRFRGTRLKSALYLAAAVTLVRRAARLTQRLKTPKHRCLRKSGNIWTIIKHNNALRERKA